MKVLSHRKWVCVNCPKYWEGSLTPGKIYDFRYISYGGDYTYLYFIGDDGVDRHYIQSISSNFITLEQHRNKKLNEIL